MNGKRWNKRKRIVASVAWALALLLMAGSGFAYWVTGGLGKHRGSAVEDLPLVSVPDGVYEGRFNGGKWSNEVPVTVSGGRVEDIEVVDDVVFADAEVREEMLSWIVREQSLRVDLVYGATVTCKAYLKAVEDALFRAGGRRL